MLENVLEDEESKKSSNSESEGEFWEDVETANIQAIAD